MIPPSSWSCYSISPPETTLTCFLALIRLPTALLEIQTYRSNSCPNAGLLITLHTSCISCLALSAVLVERHVAIINTEWVSVLVVSVPLGQLCQRLLRFPAEIYFLQTALILLASSVYSLYLEGMSDYIKNRYNYKRGRREEREREQEDAAGSSHPESGAKAKPRWWLRLLELIQTNNIL